MHGERSSPPAPPPQQYHSMGASLCSTPTRHQTTPVLCMVVITIALRPAAGDDYLRNEEMTMHDGDGDRGGS